MAIRRFLDCRQYVIASRQESFYIKLRQASTAGSCVMSTLVHSSLSPAVEPTPKGITMGSVIGRAGLVPAAHAHQAPGLRAQLLNLLKIRRVEFVIAEIPILGIPAALSGSGISLA